MSAFTVVTLHFGGWSNEDTYNLLTQLERAGMPTYELYRRNVQYPATVVLHGENAYDRAVLEPILGRADFDSRAYDVGDSVEKCGEVLREAFPVLRR